MTKIKDKQKEEVKYLLTALDRCDRCGSQAYVKAVYVSGELLFCGHHYAKSESKIKEWAFKIIDERENAQCGCSWCK